MASNTLPDKPSEIIRLALADLELVESDKRYSIDMGKWHNPYFKYLFVRKCSVCLAGAVMAKTLTDDVFAHLHPGDFEIGIAIKLTALDDFRVGDILGGLIKLDVDIPNDIPSYMDVTSYERNKNDFYCDMLKIVKTLEKFGL